MGVSIIYISSRQNLYLSKALALAAALGYLFVLIPHSHYKPIIIRLPQLAVFADRASHNCVSTIALVKLVSQEQGNVLNHDGL